MGADRQAEFAGAVFQAEDTACVFVPAVPDFTTTGEMIT
jgi:hypothetical protein